MTAFPTSTTSPQALATPILIDNCCGVPTGACVYCFSRLMQGAKKNSVGILTGYGYRLNLGSSTIYLRLLIFINVVLALVLKTIHAWLVRFWKRTFTNKYDQPMCCNFNPSMSNISSLILECSVCRGTQRKPSRKNSRCISIRTLTVMLLLII
ncbi:uncharacterized protein BCR38DRAFT_48340 [Pseudomassariella vexata]|uniref:Uncharacterized protein n=1 Tax=Pseudomassariella vexata TaxID=1141098 RepID=A0A1Y2DNL3_9PEZI|nr:uncharacterized protein BCR38DRAFT_48340 [Pseudomassariella vexata]ORY60878.1 hypothetical protein BCR38DRAFT_48340 [Pseudomassariella vexata]